MKALNDTALLAVDDERETRLIGDHPRIQEVRWRVSRAALSDATVLITGENGTGKDLVARAVHEGSRRRGGPFIQVHCGALAQDLLLSELFGHERGAFTGAYRTRQGWFETARGGTIFLDEIGSASERTQVSLLRVLQERVFERVGGDRTIRMDARVIAATNRDLEAAVAQGEFRPDLYYRLHAVRIDLPPLRERLSDLPALVSHFLRRSGERQGRPGVRVDPAALRGLQDYAWPGNVRELENAVEGAVALAREEVLTAQDLLPGGPGPQRGPGPWTRRPRVEALIHFERAFLIEALCHQQGDVARTASDVGMSRRTLYRRIRACGIDLREFRQ